MPQQPEHVSKLPTNRAFVLQLYAEANVEQGHFDGRVEHVVSGHASQFHSVEELAAFITQVLALQVSNQNEE